MTGPDVVGATTTFLLVAALGTLALGYLRLVRQWGRRRDRSWGRRRTACWLAGLGLLAVGASPTLTAAAHHDPVAHMAQHLLVGMYAPVALVLAAPVTLILGAVTSRTARRVTAVLRSPVVHVVAHPAVATVLSAGGLWLLYATPLYAATTRALAVHLLVVVHLLASGFLFAWAVAGPDPAPRRPGLVVRLGALLVSAASHAVLARTLYARAGEWPPGGHGTVDRLQEAAVLMYYGGDLAELLLAAAPLAGWYARTAPRARRAPARGLERG